MGLISRMHCVFRSRVFYLTTLAFDLSNEFRTCYSVGSRQTSQHNFLSRLREMERGESEGKVLNYAELPACPLAHLNRLLLAAKTGGILIRRKNATRRRRRSDVHCSIHCSSLPPFPPPAFLVPLLFLLFPPANFKLLFGSMNSFSSDRSKLLPFP